MQENSTWFVVYTRPRWEKKVAATLEKNAIENYCPLNRVLRQWSDRKKVLHEPLFKGYVFVRVPEIKKWEIKNIDGILNYVYWLGKPAKVKDEEIIKIRKFLSEFSEVEVMPVPVNVENAVQIRSGALMDYRGIVLEISGNKAWVKIDSMGLYLTALFDRSNLSVVK